MAGGKKCSKGCRCGKHQKGGLNLSGLTKGLTAGLSVANQVLPIANALLGQGLRGGRASHKASASRKHKQIRTQGSGLRLQGSGHQKGGFLPLLALASTLLR